MMVLRERRIMSEMGRRRERSEDRYRVRGYVRGVRVRGECAIYFPDIVKGSKDESSERPLDNTTT